MKITFVMTGYAPKPVGGYKVVYQYANALAAAGHDVTLLNTRRFLRDTPKPAARFALAKEHWAAVRGRFRARVQKRPIPWFDLDPRIQVRHFAGHPSYRPEDGEYIVATAVDTAHFSLRLASQTGRRGSYFIQHFEDWAAPKTFVEETWLLDLNKIVIAPWLQEIGTRLGVETVVVANAVDGREFSAGPSLADREPLVMSLVSKNVYKRTDIVAQVMRIVRQEFPNARGVTFGVCERPEALPSFVEHYQDPSRDRLAMLYREASVFICASDMEGFGLPPAEALLSGAAVASTDTGGVRSFGEGAILFSPPGDATALAANTLRLLSNQSEAQALVNIGQARIRDYTAEEAALAFETALLGSDSGE